MSDDVQALETPSMLDDKYRVEALLAVGGMGAVYRGRHTRLQKTVAIKVLKRELLATPELVERFQREAVAASQIGHEGIIEVTDIGTSDAGEPFLVMEFLEGSDLSTCLRAAGRLEPGTAVRICVEILSALAAAHDKSIIHRDLKPENIFVCKRSGGERVKIVDFGISRMPIEGDDSMRLTTTGMVMGTPYYMSPEQAIGESGIGTAADLYSVGVILYELITGAVPYRATNYNALLHQILQGDYPPASQLSAISPQLEAVIAKAMSTHPEERHSDARAFADALREFAEASPTLVLPSEELSAISSDTEPQLATAPTRASSVDEGIATMNTECVPEAQDTDTLGPVVTPVPNDAAARSSGKRFAAMAAVIVLLIAGGVSAFVMNGKQDKQAAASASTPPAVPAPATPAEPIPAPTLVTLTFAIAPHDAQIYVDGVEVVGRSVERPPGSFVVEVRQDGYVSQVRTVDVQADEKLAFVLDAEPVETPPAAPSLESSEPERAAAKRPSKRNEARRNKKNTNKAAPPKNKPANRRFVEDSPYDAP